MFTRLLKIWLIVSILGYGLALAGDLHGELGANNDTQWSADVNDTGNDTIDDTECHHCAHGSSHLLGLSYNDNICVIHCDGIQSGYPALSSYSFSPPSLLRPPIAS